MTLMKNDRELMKIKNKSTVLAYLGIISVVFIWGLIPSVKKALIGDSFSASVYSAITAFAAACVLLIISWGKLKEFNRSYLKIAVPTGLCVGIASLLQALAYNFLAPHLQIKRFLKIFPALSCL